MFEAARRSLAGPALLVVCVAVTGCHDRPKPAPAPAVAARPERPKVTLPPRQPGLWQITVTEDGSVDPPQDLQICIDAMTDAHLGILGTDLSGDQCPRRTVSQAGDGTLGLLASCDTGTGIVTEYSGAITGDYSHDYSEKLRAQTTSQSLPQMNRVANYMVTAKRLGECASGQQPGDVINDGVKVNLFGAAGVKLPSSAAAKDEPAGGDE
ncbi:DUF3617 domain-containing protein [Asticcacaulis solisilvae]|uniref:DUF3617 domain-containing protein n=1 Tax=Asticcacaulis solisilvae TaxID=1217274 RepID=UPI003FD8AE27